VAAATTLKVRSRPVRKARRLTFGWLFLLVTLAVSEASAQVTTSPASPTSATPVTIILTSFNSSCVVHGAISRNGFVFDVSTGYPPCLPVGTPGTSSYPVGLLVPGTYTVREVDQLNPAAVRVVGSFVVTAAVDPIPSMDARGLAALALSLTGIALLALRRFGGT
jgi:hypothetical protein